MCSCIRLPASGLRPTVREVYATRSTKFPALGIRLPSIAAVGISRGSRKVDCRVLTSPSRAAGQRVRVNPATLELRRIETLAIRQTHRCRFTPAMSYQQPCAALPIACSPIPPYESAASRPVHCDTADRPTREKGSGGGSPRRRDSNPRIKNSKFSVRSMLAVPTTPKFGVGCRELCNKLLRLVGMEMDGKVYSCQKASGLSTHANTRAWCYRRSNRRVGRAHSAAPPWARCILACSLLPTKCRSHSSVRG